MAPRAPCGRVDTSVLTHSEALQAFAPSWSQRQSTEVRCHQDQACHPRLLGLQLLGQPRGSSTSSCPESTDSSFRQSPVGSVSPCLLLVARAGHRGYPTQVTYFSGLGSPRSPPRARAVSPRHATCLSRRPGCWSHPPLLSAAHPTPPLHCPTLGSPIPGPDSRFAAPACRLPLPLPSCLPPARPGSTLVKHTDLDPAPGLFPQLGMFILLVPLASSYSSAWSPAQCCLLHAASWGLPVVLTVCPPCTWRHGADGHPVSRTRFTSLGLSFPTGKVHSNRTYFMQFVVWTDGDHACQHLPQGSVNTKHCDPGMTLSCCAAYTCAEPVSPHHTCTHSRAGLPTHLCPDGAEHMALFGGPEAARLSR